MGRLVVAAVVLGIAAFGPATAWAQRKSCDELKAQIEAKLKAKGVEKYSLEVVAPDEAKDAKVVGSCDGGTKKIVYKRA